MPALRFPLIFITGSKLPTAPRDELERFSSICAAVGAALGERGYGVVGSPVHEERVLASQRARDGLLRAGRGAVFSSAGLPEGRLYRQDRIRFVNRASAAVFIGGSAGTLEEFELAKANGVDPLIPIAGAGGAGAYLASRLGSGSGFWTGNVRPATVSVLCRADAEPAAYAKALLQVLAAHPIQARALPVCEEP